MFSKDRIDACIEIRWPEVYRWAMVPSPVGSDMSYSA